MVSEYKPAEFCNYLKVSFTGNIFRSNTFSDTTLWTFSQSYSNEQHNLFYNVLI